MMKILEQIKELYPDLRYGQIISNALHYAGHKDKDIENVLFYITDSKMEEVLINYLNTLGSVYIVNGKPKRLAN